MAETAQDRKLPATQRRIEKARGEGQVARSRDLGHLGALGAGVGLLAVFAPDVTAWLNRLVADALRFDAAQLAHAGTMVERLSASSQHALALLLPLFALVVVVALAGGALAGGWNLTWEPLQPKFEKLNPLAGLKRVFAGPQLVDTLKACLLATVLGGAAALVLSRQWTLHAQLLAMPLPAALAEGGRLLLSGLLLLVGVLAVFALVDVPLQRQLLRRRLRMSIEEVKKEMKEVEGNAEVKGKMKLRMREMVGRRMLAAVPRADLVVMNPTHYAVALKYDEATMAAPRVVAKGADLLALRMRDLARDAKVPVLQAPPLARALYAHCEVDREIPARLFGAVAQVLAWVYQVRDAMAAGRPLPGEAPRPEVPADMDPLGSSAHADTAARRVV
ncbi:MAG: EscU/YscU/HrcU family type III secretion system export apparatus switch protein [Rubrivivax sp.]|jgi:flagellar biosynthetic protein FlhB|nr:EscU/YscU/HrcU family type III secretion system export apparatus switch protein [Betaproteobacteria bacterium]MBP6463268.1 EscU/YscU/HrcU family type III secretion system export apparatus switch protein [Rubrivivax sp.]MBK7275520.1 EscU/YscU/HrcU family type III secretion system export apparatus switch protein [Betaproteobacteria bacterium]MBK7458897.1 EscU/YscU/HrcU family type III secretion system export apparatus switch protein [Betaproteobacteria bacterium]MBK7514706.1 EscU/YscU/HrcU fam